MSLFTLFLSKAKTKTSVLNNGKFLLSATNLLVLMLISNIGWGQNASATWGANASTAWYTGGNWAGGSYAGVQGAAASNANVATFSSAATATTFGINMNTASLNLGAVSIDNTRTINTNIGNSSSTASGVLRLYGATVNSVANTVTRNNSTGLLTFQATQSGTMGVVLANSTDNIFNIDNTGGITVSAIISELAAGNKLTKTGTGSGVLQLTGANTYTGLTTVSGGTLQLNRTGGTTIPVTNNVTVSSGGTLLISTAQTLNNVTVDAGGTLILANGITVTGTFTVNGTLQINSGGFTNTAPTYGSASILKYNSGGTYGRGTEWSTTSGAGYPANVQVSTSGTILNLGNGATGTARQCSGNITIDAGATLSMNVTGSIMTAALTALGNMNLAGTLVLSSSSGGDIKIGGNWSFTAGGTFTSNTRAVFFTGAAQQTISRSAAGTLNFDFLLNQNTAGGLKLGAGTDININGSGNGLQLAGTGTGNSLDLNGRTLQLGTGTNIQLTASQTITSSAGTGILKVQTGGNNNINSGTAVTTSSSVDVQLNGGMDFGSGLTTINGTLTINSGGFVTGNAPSYGTGSTLKYNSGTNPYVRGIEWGTASGPAYPYNVQISNNTNLDPGGTTRTGVTLNTANDVTIDAGSAIFMDFSTHNMTVPLIINGSLILNGSLSASGAAGGDIKVRGNWTSTGSFFPNSRAVFFDGASGTQTITKSGGQSFDYFIVDKASGAVTLANDITVNQTATLTNGIITTGSNKVIISTTGSVSRTSGHIAGNLQKHIGTGNPTVTFEIGGASNYRPVTVNFNTVGTAGDLTATVSQTAGAHPQLASSTISSTLRLDRYFTLTNSGTAFTSYDATFNYVAGDVINGADPLNFIAGKWNGSSWSYPTVGTKTSTSTQITGETSFSDFAFGELNATPTLNAGTLAGFGNVCVNTTAGPNTFTITGSALTNANVTVASLNGFSFSTDDITYTSSLSISQPGGTFSQLIYVKFSPTLVQSYDGNIVVGGGGATNINVAATGSGIHTVPTVTTAAASGVTSTAATIPGTITSIGCSAVSAYGVEYSITNGFANGTGTQAPGNNLSAGNFSVGISGLSPATTYYYHTWATNGGGTGYSTQGSFTTVTPTLSGSALTAFGNVCNGQTAGPNTFTITGTNLTNANVTVASLNGYSYSTDDITYTSSLSISQPGGSFSQLVYVKFSPTLVQSYNGNIVLGGGGAANFNEAASGSGVSTVPSLTTGGSSGVTQVAATLNGTITATGCTAVSAYGIEYSTTNGFANGSGTQAPGSNLSGGNFSVSISGLAANTTYYYHAYATNGGGTGYGGQQSFTTTVLDAPVATAATNIASTSFTANWNPVTGATSYGLDVSTSSTFTGPGVVASEPFENPLTLFGATGTGTFFSGNSAAGDRPASTPFFSQGTSSFGISNGTAVLTSGNINTTGGPASVSFKLASFSVNSAGNGADGTDIVTVEVSPNGGTTYFSTLRVIGNNNACWSFAATGTASTAYDGNATPVDFTATGGGLLAAGTSTITISGLPSASNVRIRITLLNDNVNERWLVDDLLVNGTAGFFLPGYNNLSVAGTSQSVTGLTPNTTYYYRVRGVSANSTSANSNTITAQTCQTANLNSTHNNVTCNGGTNGSIDLTVTGGTLPYAYSWTGPGAFTATTEDISSLAAGTYTVTVTSNTGCPATTSVTITEPAALSATLSGNSTICEGGSANITVTISGGTAQYSVIYNDGVSNHTAGTLNAGANSISVTPPVGTNNYSLVSITDNAGCSGSVSGAATVTVNPNYTITASAGANGSISPNGVTTLSCDGTGDQAYTITANACYSIADVVVDGVSQGAVGTFTFTDVTTNHTISASFVLNTYTITITQGANGTIAPGTGVVNCGSNNHYTITPDACYHIVDVLVDGNSQGPVSFVDINNVSANHTITASYAIDTYTITVTQTTNGTIAPGTAVVNCGSNNHYTITPDACYHIVDVLVDGNSQGPVTFVDINNVSANHTITASYAIDTYTITVTQGANGTIAPGTAVVNCGSNNHYTITPDACYHIVDVLVDGNSQGPVTFVDINNVSANHTITASYAIDTYTITVTQGANGTITPGTGVVNCGSNNHYTITPDACYEIVDVLVDGNSQGPVTFVDINNVSANHTITASYALTTYTITVTQAANGTIAPGTAVVNCGSNNHYTITPDACYHIVDVLVDGNSQGPVTFVDINNVSANHTITASYALTTYTITVTQTANGTIAPGTAVVNCGSNNHYTITPDACYEIVDVLVDGNSQGPVTFVDINNVSANHTITASYVLTTYTITVTQTANGTIAPGTAVVNCGSNNHYTITPDACYAIVDVLVDGNSQGPVTFVDINNVSANHTITATYAPTTYTITVTQTANGTIAPGTAVVNCGSNNHYTITPDACYHIVDVLVDGNSQGPVTFVDINNVSANHTITASYAIDTYTITVTQGANGTIAPGTAVVNCGSNNHYTITPDACYHIVDVLVDGNSQGPVTFVDINNVSANHTITASYAIDTYTITVTQGANGTIAPGTAVVNCGSNNHYTITPDACYEIVDVLVDGNSQGPVTFVDINNVSANHTITASYALTTYTITVTQTANGTIAPGTGVVNCGSNNHYTITPDACYAIVDVLVDGNSQGPVSFVDINNVSANHTITASYALTTYTITVTQGANGTIAPGTAVVNCGSNNHYTITPDACYHIVDVLVDGNSQGPVSFVDINNVSANHTITASYAIDTYTITVTQGANGTIAPGTAVVNCGSNNHYTITPIACYHIVDVLVDGNSQGPVSFVDINNVSANHTITASYAINTALATPVVTGPVNVCQYVGTPDQVVYTASSAGATGYTWVVPPTNVTIISGQGTATLTVTFQAGFTAQPNKQIRVTGLSACGNSPLSIYYLTATTPGTPQAIVASSTNICAVIGTPGTITYTIPSVPGATSYSWSAQALTTSINHPNGLGVNDTTVTVSFTTGFSNSNISVVAVNSGCGAGGTRSLLITRSNPSTPGLISGPTNACPYMAPGGTPAVYSVALVPNATSYTWTVPAGAIGLTGQGTNTISFTYPNTFVSGSITVSATNGCGTSAVRSLTINKLNPATPSIIDVIQTQPCPNREYTYTLSGMPANATSVQWTIPVGATLVSGQGTISITVSYPGTAFNSAVTAQAFNNCGSSSIRSTTVHIPACPPERTTIAKGGSTITMPTVETLQVNVYPNPTVNNFKLQVTTAAKEAINVRILDLQGRELKHFVIAAYQATNVGSDLKAGTYMLEVRQGDNVKITKLIKF